MKTTTVSEIEAMLSDPEGPAIEILPNGEILVSESERPVATKVLMCKELTWSTY